MICTKCDGDGLIHKGLDYVCKDCGGSGKIMEEEVIKEEEVEVEMPGPNPEEESFLVETGEELSELSPDEE